MKKRSGGSDIYIISLDTFMLLAVLGITLGLILIVVNASIPYIGTVDPKKIEFDVDVLDNYLDENGIETFNRDIFDNEYEYFRSTYPSGLGKLRTIIRRNAQIFSLLQIRGDAQLNNILRVIKIDFVLGANDAGDPIWKGSIAIENEIADYFKDSAIPKLIKQELNIEWADLYNKRLRKQY